MQVFSFSFPGDVTDLFYQKLYNYKRAFEDKIILENSSFFFIVTPSSPFFIIRNYKSPIVCSSDSVYIHDPESNKRIHKTKRIETEDTCGYFYLFTRNPHEVLDRISEIALDSLVTGDGIGVLPFGELSLNKDKVFSFDSKIISKDSEESEILLVDFFYRTSLLPENERITVKNNFMSKIKDDTILKQYIEN